MVEGGSLQNGPFVGEPGKLKLAFRSESLVIINFRFCIINLIVKNFLELFIKSLTCLSFSDSPMNLGENINKLSWCFRVEEGSVVGLTYRRQIEGLLGGAWTQRSSMG